MQEVTIISRILLAAFLGALVGFEREIHGCAAGLRTHILVTVGSAVFMVTSITVAASYGHIGDSDPARIAAQVVTGIGFLGAGAIIRYGASIRGLTTAASIWAVAAIGLSAGAGLYLASGVTTLVVIGVLFLSRLEERMELKRLGKKLVVELRKSDGTTMEDVKTAIEGCGGNVKHLVSKTIEGKDGMVVITVDVMLPRIYQREVVAEVASLPGVDEVGWE